RNRHPDGTWAEFDPSSSRGFAEGSAAQYTWMVPHDVAGLMEAMGGVAEATRRLDAFFHTPDGDWALTGLGGLHAEMDNEPTIGAPWAYLYTGEPSKAQEIMREVQVRLWSDRPHGIPGNDDLGAMSSWYVWSALGMYPGIPGRAELFLSSPLFPLAVVERPEGNDIIVRAPDTSVDAPYVQGLTVDGQAWRRPWLPEVFVERGGELVFRLGPDPHPSWGSGVEAAPPSFGGAG
ncbi:MAG: glycoside hydrolase family 92 protein, partial [Gemmatimonadota bacterium]